MAPDLGSLPDLPSAPLPEGLTVLRPGQPGPVDLDTGDAGREAVAVAVAAARMAGAGVVRTGEPRAARRAAQVVDAIAAAGSGARAVGRGGA